MYIYIYIYYERNKHVLGLKLVLLAAPGPLFVDFKFSYTSSCICEVLRKAYKSIAKQNVCVFLLRAFILCKVAQKMLLNGPFELSPSNRRLLQPV